MNIVFFNQFHNGDCFVGKGWVRNIIAQIPEAKFYYAHKNHADIIKDVPAEMLTLSDIPDIPNRTKIVQNDDGDIFINTWCGAFQGELFHTHSNYIVQHRMYEIYCERLSQLLGRPITQSTNPHDYLPEIDFNEYNVAGALNFLEKHGRLNLFCNGSAMSGQSAIGDMRGIIDRLCQDFPQETFVATYDMGLRHDNLYYTQDIFKLDSDLNQIAFLSQRAGLIVGKNSGPYTYCQFKKNMERDDVTFFCFGKLLTDCLNAGLEFPARFKFSDQTNEQLLYGMLHRHLITADPGYRTGMQHIYA
jgi:hypothetical protein